MSRICLFSDSSSLDVARLKWLEHSVWYVYLALMVWVSFIFAGYASKHWLLFSSVFYAWATLLCVLVCSGGRYSFKALVAAKPVLLLLAASLVWLWMQLNFSLEHHFYDLFTEVGLSTVEPPQWFATPALWSVSPERGHWLLMSEVLMSSIFLVSLILIDSRARLTQLLIVIMLIGLSHSLIGLWGKFAGLLFVDVKELDGHITAARGFFINRNHFGAFVSLCLVGAFAFQLRAIQDSANQWSWKAVFLQLLSLRVFAWLVIAVSLLAVAAGESRGALLALLAGALLAVISTRSQGVGMASKALMPIFMLAGIGLFYGGQELVSRFASDSIGLGERGEQWLLTLKAISDNPLFGYGGGSYATVFQSYRDAGEFRQVIYAQSHNHYLHLWLERGFVGLMMWGAILFYAIKRARKMASHHASRLVRSTALACLAVILCALIQSLVDFNLQILNIRAYFFVVLALIFAVPEIKHRRAV